MEPVQEEESNFTVDVFLSIGLHVAGFRIQQLSRRTQTRRFKDMYGCSPVVVKHVWDDLKSKVSNKAKIEHLFWALFFLKRYPTEGEMAGRLGKDPATLRSWIWTIIYGLQELKADKIVFPSPLSRQCKPTR